MSKFKKKSKASQEIPTSALPDIIFMLLFFFMVSTVLRETEMLVKQAVPDASQITKLQRKSLVSYIYIGEPKDPKTYGTEPKIQINDVIAETTDIVNFVYEEKDKLSEGERDALTVSLKVDREAKMGIVTDVQEELKEAQQRKIMYNAVKGTLD
jgi:biopolymer transport protein ExbD